MRGQQITGTRQVNDFLVAFVVANKQIISLCRYVVLIT